MSFWHLLFSLAAYLSAALCVVSIFRLAAKGHRAKALCQLLLLLLLVVAYWLFESWATYILPYYTYDPHFWDRVPFFPWSIVPGVPAPYVDSACRHLKSGAWISLSVPVMEAALTFAMLRTAALLAPTLVPLQPFLVGLAALALDLFLDPISAKSFNCATSCTLSKELWLGLGFWEWQVHAKLSAPWFSIPLFNFAAWYAAPIALAALVLLIEWVCDFVRWVRGGRPAEIKPSFWDGTLRGAIFFAYTFLFGISPTDTTDEKLKELIMLLTLLATLYLIYVHRSLFKRTNPWRWELVIAQLVFYGFSLLALFFAGLQVTPLLLLAALVLTALGTYYAVSPYL